MDGRWVKIGESNGGGVYIDGETLVRDHGKGGSVWMRIYRKDHSFAQLEEEFLCGVWKEHSVRIISYNGEGVVVASAVMSSQDEAGRWEHPVPAGVTETLMEVVCAR
jgi:hypothetical protein